MPSAKIFDIQRGSMVDGPGIRTVFFFHGCPLRCAWCHNPEGIGTARSDDFAVREYTVRELLDIACEDIPFYHPDGGVTCSGGECMLQTEFLAEFLKECKENGIHTAVDTAGYLPFDRFLSVLPYTDLFLYDLKAYDSEVHKRLCGRTNERILENLRDLDKTQKRIEIRIPLVPGYTDDQIEPIGKFLCTLSRRHAVRVLPYHHYYESKYDALDMECVRGIAIPTKNTVEKAKELLRSFNLQVLE